MRRAIDNKATTRAQRLMQLFKRKRSARVLIVGGLCSLLVVAYAIPTTFIQTDWSGGASALTATDPTNQTGWTKYSSADVGMAVVNAGADLQLTTSASALTHTYSSDFAPLASSILHTTHADFATSATLSNVKVNNGAVGLKPAILAPTWVAKPAWDLNTAKSYNVAAYADLDNDGDLDMLVGASDGYTYGYRNVGTDENPSWQAYPSWNMPRVSTNTHAVPALGDFDNDGDIDLFLGNGGNLIQGYENIGSKTIPIWVAKPAWDLTTVTTAIPRPFLVDINNDGQLDLMVGGNWSGATIYAYSYSTATQTWTQQTTWQPTANLGAPQPSLGDLDNDGDMDMVVGAVSQANILGYTNTGTVAAPAWSQNFSGPANAAQYDIAMLVDIDSDGDLDLMMASGGTSSTTVIYGYENQGTTYNTNGTYTSAVIDAGSHYGFTTLSYTLVTPTGATVSVDVRAGNTAVPDGTWSAWQTNVANGGNIAGLGNSRYVQYRANLATVDTSVTPLLKDISINYTPYPSATNISAIGDQLSLKLVSRVVSWDTVDSGTLTVVSGQPDGSFGTNVPAVGDLNGDGWMDMILGDTGTTTALGAYRNNGNNTWTYQSSWNLPYNSSSQQTLPTLADIDGDGDLDAMVGAVNSTNITAYENTGTASAPVWTAKPAWDIAYGINGANATLADLDGDGDLDLMASHVGTPHEIRAYENQGTRTAPVWVRKTAWDVSATVVGSTQWTKRPVLEDIDGDGDYDLIIGDSDTSRVVIENTGDRNTPFWGVNTAWLPPVSTSTSHYGLVDMDGDGAIDVVIGDGTTVRVRRNTGASVYAASGTYNSAVLDFGVVASYGLLNYTANIRTGTSLSVDVRGGNTTNPGDGSWTAWTPIANGGNLSVFGTRRYLQYRVNMTSNGTNTLTPELKDITINYSGLASPRSLISSAYNSTFATNFVTGLAWTETLPASSDVRVQIRTAPDSGGVPGTWSAWMGPDGTSASYWNSSNAYIGGCFGSGTISCTVMPSVIRDGANDQWFQYKVTLMATGASSPTLSDISVTYASSLPPGVTIVPVAGLTTTEAGGTATFTVVLDSAPTANVVIALSSSDLSEGTVSPASLTFTSANWSTPQTVTVTGVDDFVDDGDVAYSIITAPASSTDVNYNGLDPNNVSVTNIDNDTAEITVTPTSGLVTTEAGGTAAFSVVLTSQPLANVVIAITSSDTTEGTLSTSSLTFTSANWNTPQAVTVTGVDDGIVDGNIAYTLVTAAAVSTDGLYNGVNPPDVSAVNNDNDVASLTVTPTSGLVTTENGGTATFTISIGSQPTSDVTINLTSTNVTEGSVSPNAVTFTAANWATPQTVTVKGLDDGVVDGNIGYTIITSNAISADSIYNGWVLPDVMVTNNDNDAYGFVVTPTSGLVTTEAGGTAAFTIRMASMPIANITVALSSSAPGEGAVSPSTLTFNSGNWSLPQVVVVTGVDDALVDGDVAYSIVTAPASGPDPNYNGLNPPDVSLINIDNDTSGATAGFGQTNWGSGVPANSATCAALGGTWTGSFCSATAPTNMSGWTAYSTKTSDLIIANSAADLTLGSKSKSKTFTSSADFPAAVSSKLHTTRRDFATGATLSNTKVNNGAVGLKPATLAATWVAKAAWDFDTTKASNIVTYGDLDNDGDLDMLVGASDGYVYGYRNIGTDESPSWQAYSSWNMPRVPSNSSAAPALGDFDNDGDLDLFVGQNSNQVLAYENVGSKTIPVWVAKPAWNLTTVPTAVVRPVLVDINNDGQLDLLAGGNYSAATIYAYSYNTGTQTWTQQTTWQPTASLGAPQPSVGDLNNDGTLDMVVGAGSQANILGYTNTGTVSAPAWSQNFTGPTNAAQYDFATLIDIDSDGDLDLMMSSGGTGSTTIVSGYENQGTTYNSSGTYTSAVIDAGSHYGFTNLSYTVVTPVGTSLTVDARAGNTAVPDGTWTAWQTNIASGGTISALGNRRYVQYRLNLGTTNTAVTPIIKDVVINYLVYPLAQNVVTAGDAINLKRSSQAVNWDTVDSGSLTVVTGQPDGNFSINVPGLGDLNGDGALDLILGDNGAPNALGAYRNNGNNTWTYQSSWNLPFNPGYVQNYVMLADLDNDGDLDAMVGNVGSTSVVAYENTGTASAPVWTAKPAWNIAHGITGANAALADMDGDGDLDAMVSHQGTPYEVHGYENQGTPSAPVWVRKVAWDVSATLLGSSQWNKRPTLGDIDGDGDYDMIIGDGDTSRVVVENTGDKNTPFWAVANAAWLPPVSTTSSHYGLADMDDDSDFDVVIGDGTAVRVRKNLGAASYLSSGSYTSGPIDFGAHLGFTALNYTATIRTGTALTVEVRGGNTANPEDGSWSAWTPVASGGSLTGFGTLRYLQYRANLTASVDQSLAPTLKDITFNYSGVASEANLESTPFNTNIATNLVTELRWSESLAAGTDVRIQMRIAPDSAGSPGTWSNWMGPDGSVNSYYNSTNTYAGGCSGSGAITCTNIAPPLRNGQNAQWVQYKVTLVSSGTAAPVLSDIYMFFTTAAATKVTVTPASGLVTNESGLTAQFTVVLNSAPAANVMIDFSSSDLTEATVSPATLTFTSANWNTPQTVTLTGVADTLADGNVPYTVYSSATRSSDVTFNNLLVADVAAVNNDTVGTIGSVTVTPISGLVTTEAGGTAQFSVVLNSAPTADVSINLSSSDTTEGTVSPSIITFTSLTWNTPQLVTVTGVDDTVFDQDVTYTVITSATASADPNYAGLVVDDVSVTNTDNESFDIAVMPSAGLTTTESGGMATATIVLASQPSANVTFTLTSSDVTEGVVSPFSMTFTPANWNVPQTITIFGVNDNIIDGNIAYSIITGAYSSADPNFNGKNPSDISVVNNDDDAYSISVYPSSGLITTEAGDKATFFVKLGARPTADVIIYLTSSDPTEGSVPPYVVIRPDDLSWTGVPVEVTGLDDAIYDTDQPYTIITAAAISADLNYNGINPPDVSVTNKSMTTSALVGNNAGASFGRSVAIVGDVNGDGYADIVVGAPNYTNSFANEGRATLYLGSASGYVGAPAWTVYGGQANAFFGFSVAGVGDVNKDGYDDVIVGAYGFDNAFVDAGKVYVYYGSATGLSTIPAWTAEGDQANAYLGFSVASAGDVNGDTNPDVIIGAYGRDNTLVDEGRAYVYTSTGVGGLSIVPVWTADGGQASAFFGASVATAGDVNKDGYADVIVGAYGYDNPEVDEGKVFVYYGSATGPSATPSWTAESNQAGANFGRAVAGGMDVNNDTYSDIVIGAPLYSNGQTNEGRVYAYYGSASGLSATPNWITESNQASAYYGFAVANAGDHNKDGYGDIVVGAYLYDNGQTDEGRAYIYHGSATGLEGGPANTFESDQVSAQFGIAVGGNGDLNNDGYGDIVIGANLYDNTLTDEGAIFVFRGVAQTPNIIMSPVSGLTINEKNGGVSVGIRLDSPPTADVVLNFASTDTTEGTVYPTSLTFTPTNWRTIQPIRISAVDDNIDDGDVVFQIVTAPAVSTDPAYNGMNPPDLTVTNIDDDTTVSVSVPDAAAAEAGANTGTIQFNRTPPLTAPLTVNFNTVGSTSVPGQDYTASSYSSITIPAGAASASWTITPVDDAIAEGAETVVVNLDTNGNSYLIGAPSTGVVNITDNDTAGVNVTPSSGLVTTESGGSATFSVVLTSQPTADITINLSSSKPGEGLTVPTALKFTAVNWNVPQVVTVVGQDDAVTDGDIAYSIVTSAALSADPNYSGMAVTDVSLTNLDNESTATITVDTLAGSVVENSGLSANFRLRRTGPTTSPLTVNYTVSGTATAGTDYTALSGTVTIPAGSATAAVAVTPINDAIAEGEETVVLNVSANAAYMIGKPGGATITIIDDELPPVPVANFAIDQIQGEGKAVTVTVELDRPASVYPVTIPYTVSGTATNPADHNAADGSIVIAAGTIGSVVFNTVNDGIPESNETVVFTMGTPTHAVAGSHNVHTVTITDNNAAPSVLLAAVQGSTTTRLVVKGNGNVTVTATVNDPNPLDTHTYNWSLSNNNLVDIPDGNPATFLFDPTGLAAGYYAVRLTVTDSGTPNMSTSVDLLLQVVDTAPVLSAVLDSDGDGIVDSVESYTDVDNDGVPNYLDSDSLVTNELQQLSVVSGSYVIRTEVGLTIGLGPVAFAAGADGAAVTVTEIATYGNGEGGAGINATDTVANAGGYFDFVITGLARAGQSVKVVIPQLAPIPVAAVYRKYNPLSGWRDFVQDANNSVASAPGTPGVCPPPGDAAYTAGLTPGNYCVQLTIEDGGQNDTDNSANREVADPGKLGEVLSTTPGTPPSPGASTPTGGGGGGGAVDWLWGILLLWTCWQNWRRSPLRFRFWSVQFPRKN